jgi:predicted RNase H-like HicB family nuclease
VEFPELQFVVKPDVDGGFYAFCDMPGHAIATQGDSLDELYDNVLEVSLLYLEDLADEKGLPAPQTARFAMHFPDATDRAA